MGEGHVGNPGVLLKLLEDLAVQLVQLAFGHFISKTSII
jgi:hypothetical protein